MNRAEITKGIEQYPIQFEGSGGEYFRVWIVNILLSLLTLGLYTPFARRRTAQYFYGHTFIADSPLEFTAQPRKMFFGFLVLVFFSLLFNFASNANESALSSVLIFAGAALAPYFWASAMRFRLGSTRWRGVRLQFNAPWREVYVASWPVFALAAVWVGVIVVAWLASGTEQEPSNKGIIGAAIVLALALSLLCLIRLSFNYQSLLVLHARIGNQAGRWKPQFRHFVRIWLASAGLFLLCVLVLTILGLVLGGVSLADQLSAVRGVRNLAMMLLGVVVALFAILISIAPALAYREASMFRLVWSNTGVSQIARFKCSLSRKSFVFLRLKNLLLSTMTLGLYRPFARVAEYKFKVESVQLYVKGGVDQLVGQLVEQQGALGDALADAAGLDLIS